MKKIRKIALTAMTSAIVLASAVGAGCSGSDSQVVKLTLWGSLEEQSMLTSMVNAFKEANPETEYDIKLGICTSANAYTQIRTDVSAGADVYEFANDQLINLYNAGALAKLGSAMASEVTQANSAESVAQSTIGNSVYAYPFAADNGYFLWYNSTLITEEEAGSFESLIAACEKNNLKILLDLDNSWYAAGFFFGTGCSYEVNYSLGAIDGIECNFNDGAKGVAAGKEMISLANSSVIVNAGDEHLSGYVNDGTLGACIYGTWVMDELEKSSKYEFKATKLPEFTVDGATYQMGNFIGYKMYGVNPTSSNLAEAHKLAQFLTSYEMQVKRYDDLGTKPTNTSAADLERVKTDKALVGLDAQNATGKAVVQTAVPSTFWDGLTTFATMIANKGITEENLQSELNTMVTSIKQSM